MSERWLPVVGYEGLYEVSDQGRIWSDISQIYLKLNQSGGPQNPVRVTLWRSGKQATHLVGRTVLEAFVGQCPKGLECCHFDDDKWNNQLTNLRWDTHSANTLDRVRNGIHTKANKTQCPQGHDYTPENVYTKRDGGRQCRQCGREATLRWYHSRKAKAA